MDRHSPPEDPRRAGDALACPVRGCAEVLVPTATGLACARGHAFDRARSGYVNLLQPGDRRSLAAGDRPEATRARARLAERGVGRELREAAARAVRRAVGHATARPAVVAEVGCGGGELLGPLAAGLGASARCFGIDLSATAVDRAARRHAHATWLVANADRRLPFAGGALDVLVSIAGPKQPEEFARVVAGRGRLVVGVPAPDDLAELRAAVQGEAREEDRAARAIAQFAERFELEARERASERVRLDAEGLGDLLLASYRGARRSAEERVRALGELDVTVALDVLTLVARA